MIRQARSCITFVEFRWYIIVQNGIQCLLLYPTVQTVSNKTNIVLTMTPRFPKLKRGANRFKQLPPPRHIIRMRCNPNRLRRLAISMHARNGKKKSTYRGRHNMRKDNRGNNKGSQRNLCDRSSLISLRFVCSTKSVDIILR
jgi:hypothetical protein